MGIDLGQFDPDAPLDELHSEGVQSLLALLRGVAGDRPATLRDVAAVVQRGEMVHRIASEIETMIVELGNDARLLRMQLDELYGEIDDEIELVIDDYLPGGCSATETHRLMAELDDESAPHHRSAISRRRRHRLTPGLLGLLSPSRVKRILHVARLDEAGDYLAGLDDAARHLRDQYSLRHPVGNDEVSRSVGRLGPLREPIACADDGLDVADQHLGVALLPDDDAERHFVAKRMLPTDVDDLQRRFRHRPVALAVSRAVARVRVGSPVN